MCENTAMDVRVEPGDPLAQPTRARLFKLINDRAEPLSTEQLADELGMHANGIRLHLERLVDAGLIARDRESVGRGRPRDVWRVSPAANPGGVAPTGYSVLSRWLVRSLVSSGATPEDVEAAGREIGRELAAENTGGPTEDRFFNVLTSLGFQPERTPLESGETHYCLQNCPYRDAVVERQNLVCGLHRGMSRGMVEQLEPGSEVVSFVPKSPETAGCEIEVRGPAADSGRSNGAA